MEDAVLASKCCFQSFCDKCIRDRLIWKSMCECGATHVIADDLLPNKTVRDSIDRILNSNNSSAENGGSASPVQGMESKGAVLAGKEEQQKPISGEAGQKKKMKKVCRAPGVETRAEMRWSVAAAAFNPGWNCMQPGFMPYGDAYGAQFLPYAYGPQRDLCELVYNAMSREALVAGKADLKRKRETDNRDEMAITVPRRSPTSIVRDEKINLSSSLRRLKEFERAFLPVNDF